RGRLIVTRQHVRIHGARNVRRRVPGTLRHDTEWLAGAEQHRHVGVAKSVQGDAGELGVLHALVEPLRETLRVDRCAVLADEYEVAGVPLARPAQLLLRLAAL